MSKVKPLVFLPPFLLCAAFVVLQMVNEKQFVGALSAADTLVTGGFGWLVSLLSVGMLALCGIIYVSSFGRTVLGGPNAKKLLTHWQMFAVVLTTNIATGILFWGVFEPVSHLSHPPHGIAPNSPEAAHFAISTVYLHWTLTPYAFGSIVGLMFAFAYFNMRQPFSLGAPLAPLLGHRGGGRLAEAIDAVCLYCLVAGLTAALAGSAPLGGECQHRLPDRLSRAGVRAGAHALHRRSRGGGARPVSRTIFSKGAQHRRRIPGTMAARMDADVFFRVLRLGADHGCVPRPHRLRLHGARVPVL
jgi:choline-glycine betaine transporter